MSSAAVIGLGTLAVGAYSAYSESQSPGASNATGGAPAAAPGGASTKVSSNVFAPLNYRVGSNVEAVRTSNGSGSSAASTNDPSMFAGGIPGASGGIQKPPLSVIIGAVVVAVGAAVYFIIKRRSRR